MRRSILVLFCLLVWVAAAAAAQDLDQVIIPRKTEIFMTIGRTINTKTAAHGDRFHGTTDVPVTVNDRTVIPRGSYIIGSVDLSEQPGRLKGKAQLRLTFDTVILPEGTTRKIEAVVQSAEGQTRKPGDEEGTLQAPGSQGREAAGGAAGGAVTGGVIGGISGGLGGAGVGSAVGAATGALLGVFKKGKQVIIQKGSSITIQLENDIRFVKPGATTSP